MPVSPPKVASFILRATLSRTHRDLVLAELNEEYAQKIRPTRSWWSARAWYWRQALGSAVATLASRMRPGFRARPHTGLWTDVRNARRDLFRSPGFTATVVATFALGIGATAAMFSVLDAVILRPLPYSQPDQLVRPWPDGTISKAVMETVLETTTAPNSSFQSMAGYYETRQAVDTDDGALEALGLFVGRDFFAVLGATPQLGRVFLPESDDTVIISAGLWRRQFQERANIVGQAVTIGGQRRTIVGVMPPRHRPLVRGVDFWLPMQIDRDDFSDYQGVAQVNLLGRLETEHSEAGAAAELATTAQLVRNETPASYSQEWVARSRPVALHTVLVRDVRLAVWMVMGAVSFLLLIACANVSNLLMVRAISRRTDVAVRIGLGATPWRIVRQRLTEGTLLGLAGGALGAVLALGLVRVIEATGTSALTLGDRIETDLSFLAFTCVVTLGASLLSSAGPSLASARSQPHSLLASGGRSSVVPARALKLNRAVVGVAVALAVVLVIGSTLMFQTVIRLGQVDPGFESAGVTSMRVRFPDFGPLSDPVARTQFLADVVESLQRIPGAQSAAAVSFLPMATGTPTAVYKVDGQEYPEDAPPPAANFQLVVGDYHDTLRIPLRRGRWFEPTDSAEAPVVSVINETLASQAFGDADPIGRTITMFGGVQFEVVGLIADTHQRQPSTQPAPEALFAYRQLSFWPGMFLTVRSAGRTPTTLELRSAVSQVHGSVPVSDIKPMHEVVAGASSQTRVFSQLLTAFGLLAVLLGGVGIYGLVKQDVSQRLPEFSIRIALGATRRQVMRTALTHSLLPSLVGVAVGTAAAAWLSRGLRGLLFGISPVDMATFIVVPAVLLTVTLAAAYVPARRATTANPATILR